MKKTIATLSAALMLSASMSAMAADVDFSGQNNKPATAASKEVDFTGTKATASQTATEKASKELDFSKIKAPEEKVIHLRPEYAEKEKREANAAGGTNQKATTRAGYSQRTTRSNGTEISSIDAIDQGVADTGETNYTNKDAKIVPSTAGYRLAVLPYVDTSGLEGRSREMAVGAVKDNLKIKYDSKKSNVQVLSSAAVQNAMARYPFENAESPTLDELVKVGEACGADRVIFVNIMPARQKESGFMVVVGTQTYSSTVTMKLKCVDTNTEQYLFNQNVEGVGSSSSVNFWRIGEPSHAKAVKRGVTECMKLFLTSFD